MAVRKGFLDLPAELRNQVYEYVARDHYVRGILGSGVSICTKRPGALIDRWNRVTYQNFFNDEIFQSGSAIIAANRQIHSEFYAVLKDHILEEARFLTFHVSDFDFQPLMDWFDSLAKKQKTRFQTVDVQMIDSLDDDIFGERSHDGRSNAKCSIDVALDFERFTPVSQTNLKEWIIFAGKFNINVNEYSLTTLHPLQKEWIRHGPSYPQWLKEYRDFVVSSAEPMRRYSWEIQAANPDFYAERCWDPVDDIGDALREPKEEFDRMGSAWWYLSTKDFEKAYRRRFNSA